jgi:hypothetical protein
VAAKGATFGYRSRSRTSTSNAARSPRVMLVDRVERCASCSIRPVDGPSRSRGDRTKVQFRSLSAHTRYSAAYQPRPCPQPTNQDGDQSFPQRLGIARDIDTGAADPYEPSHPGGAHHGGQCGGGVPVHSQSFAMGPSAEISPDAPARTRAAPRQRVSARWKRSNTRSCSSRSSPPRRCPRHLTSGSPVGARATVNVIPTRPGRLDR